MLRHGKSGTNGTLNESSTLSSLGCLAITQIVRIIPAATINIKVMVIKSKLNLRSVQSATESMLKMTTLTFVMLDDKLFGCLVNLKLVICLRTVVRLVP